MSFVDKVSVKFMAGPGGDGKLSFRHEWSIAKGGPDGGDGGGGGDVILKASHSQNTLSVFRYRKEIKAVSGQAGGKRRKTGKRGDSRLVEVPLGTLVTDQTGHELADLTEEGQMVVVAKGGRGGFGNAHFVSSRRQTPRFAEKGEPGESLTATLELKMIADVGLVGLPNVGKSTLLSKISGARPEIADYPFTTLSPHLGVVDIDEKSSLLFADIPGLIKGAAKGRGLGHDFLRHIERTAVIVHLIDGYSPSPAADYQTVVAELKSYSKELAARPALVVLTKTEGLAKRTVEEATAQLKKVLPKGKPVLAISALSGDGLKPFLYEVETMVKASRAKQPAEPVETLPIITLGDESSSFNVAKRGGTYVVKGRKLEQFALRTDFSNEQAIQRLRDILRRSGVFHELLRQGLQAGETIQIGDNPSHSLIY